MRKATKRGRRVIMSKLSSSTLKLWKLCQRILKHSLIEALRMTKSASLMRQSWITRKLFRSTLTTRTLTTTKA